MIILLLIGIVILKIYDGRQLPNWPYGIMLNTVISILSVFLSVSMIVAVAAGISQLKMALVCRFKDHRMKTCDLRPLTRPAEALGVVSNCSREVGNRMWPII